MIHRFYTEFRRKEKNSARCNGSGSPPPPPPPPLAHRQWPVWCLALEVGAPITQPRKISKKPCTVGIRVRPVSSLDIYQIPLIFHKIPFRLNSSAAHKFCFVLFLMLVLLFRRLIKMSIILNLSCVLVSFQDAGSQLCFTQICSFLNSSWSILSILLCFTNYITWNQLPVSITSC